jgi:hypothetical protein
MRAPRAGSGEPCRLLGEAVNALTANDILSAAISLAGATAPPPFWIHPGNVW